VKDESWGEKVGKTLSSEEGKEREAVGKLLGLGDRVGMVSGVSILVFVLLSEPKLNISFRVLFAQTFNGLHSTLSSHINERTRLSNLSNHLLASRPLIEDHSNLIGPSFPLFFSTRPSFPSEADFLPPSASSSQPPSRYKRISTPRALFDCLLRGRRWPGS